MGRHLDIADVFVGLRVKDSYFPIALSRILATIADIDQLRVWIVDDAVGSRFNLDRIQKLERVSSKNSHHSVVAACQE